jgi:Tol biopolymer transport system component
MAAAFDIASLSIKSPAAVQQRITVKSARGDVSADYSMGLDGSLVFAPTALSETQRLIWVDRAGKILSPLTDQPLQNPRYPRISPDGRRLAVTIGPSNEGQIWLYDLATSNQPLKLTFKGHNTQPTWAPNGRHIAFSSTILGPRNLFRLPADASSLEPERLTTNANVQIPLSWSPSGDDLLFREVSARTRDDIWLLPMTGNREPRPWLPLTEFADDEATFAPNGRWVAYVTDQTGQPEVWIRPFPGPGSPTRVSPSGGHDPIWARNGRELFYQIDGKLMAADVTATESQLQVKAPRMLFQGGFQPYAAGLPATYDVAPDGRFLMIESNDSAPASIVIVKNWLEELKRLVPVR